MARTPVNPVLLEQALAGALTRKNTASGSEERKAVYASEYQRRATSSKSNYGVSYSDARALRRLYPLSSKSRAELHAHHKNLSREHTRYAVIRANIARAELANGKHISKTQQKSLRYISDSAPIPAPVAAIKVWYEQSWTDDLPRYAFEESSDTGYASLGAMLGDYDDMNFIDSDLYDIDWGDDLSDWDMYDFGDY